MYQSEREIAKQNDTGTSQFSLILASAFLIDKFQRTPVASQPCECDAKEKAETGEALQYFVET